MKHATRTLSLLALLSLIAALVCAFFLHIPDHAAEAEATAAEARA